MADRYLVVKKGAKVYRKNRFFSAVDGSFYARPPNVVVHGVRMPPPTAVGWWVVQFSGE
jgi:hypothetical protein